MNKNRLIKYQSVLSCVLCCFLFWGQLSVAEHHIEHLMHDEDETCQLYFNCEKLVAGQSFELDWHIPTAFSIVHFDLILTLKSRFRYFDSRAPPLLIV